MKSNLCTEKRFLPLLVTQFLGALNDNLFKNALMTFVTYQLLMNEQTAGLYANVIAGAFILPFFLFSAPAGLLADKYSRNKIARILKIIELFLMVLAFVFFELKNPACLILLLFLLGVHSTFFGPVKYSLLPQLLKPEELVAGNAYIEATTYISIILGAMLGTCLPTEFSLALLILFAFCGVYSSFQIPNVAGAEPELKIDWNLGRQIKENITLIKTHIIVFRTIMGATWFWVLGAFFLTELFPLCSKVFNTGKSVVTLFLILFSMGVGCGSIFCSRLLKGEVSVVYVPISAVGLSFCAFVIYLLSAGFPAPAEPLSLGCFLLQPRGLFLTVFLFLFAFFGGLYIVPLNALMQKKAPKKHTAAVIAGNNIVNSLGMAAISLFAVVLIAFGFKITDLFLFVAVISAAVAFYICRLLPDALVRSLFRSVLQLFFRVKVNGLKNLTAAGSKVLIIANHVSLLDGLLIATYLPRKITFAIDSDWGKKWYVRLFDGLVDFYPLNPANPLAVRSLIEEINKNKTVVIFPEGRISITGSLMKVYEGAGVVAQKSGAKLIPLRIDGAQYSKFSYLGNLLKTRIFPKIKMFVLPACRIDVPPELSNRERRRMISLKLYDLMADMIYDTTDKNISLFDSLLLAEKIYGKHHKIAMDISKKTLDYGQFLLKSYVLGAAFSRSCGQEEKIGIFLPNSLACAVSFFALQKAEKVPVMLNFSLGEKQFLSCLKTVGLKTVVTSRRFIEQGKLERFENCIKSSEIKLIYLEDFAGKISPVEKLAGLMRYFRHEKTQSNAEKTAVILFTSGSEGLPKAILLSHKNIQANILQLRLAVPFTTRDVFLNALPMFHSFGLTVGTILPLLYGVKTFFYPSPLHYRIIPELAYEVQATVICGTDAFLYGYGRMASPYDFFQIRFAVEGGEKLKSRTSGLWMQKFGVRILEGYGATETAPVISVNTPLFYREESVGRLLPRISCKLQRVKGVAEGGRLLLKGDNVMQGCILPDNPEVVVYHKDWYDTGDIVQIDEDGYLFIRGREKRFAKIAGEMVSLTAVEHALEQIYPDSTHGVLAFPDDKKGEKLVWITSEKEADLQKVKSFFTAQGLSLLWVPREIVYLVKPPLSGSGKFDYQSAEKLLRQEKIL